MSFKILCPCLLNSGYLDLWKQAVILNNILSSMLWMVQDASMKRRLMPYGVISTKLWQFFLSVVDIINRMSSKYIQMMCHFVLVMAQSPPEEQDGKKFKDHDVFPEWLKQNEAAYSRYNLTTPRNQDTTNANASCKSACPHFVFDCKNNRFTKVI